MHIFRKRIVARTSIVMLIVLMLLMMQFQPFTDEVQWDEVAVYGFILLVVGCFYELWQWLKMCNKTYRLAFVLGLA